MRRVAVCLVSAVLLVSCEQTPEGVERTVATASKVLPSAAVPADRAANDVGRFLAGLPGLPGSPYIELEREAAWQAHRRELDREWGQSQSGEIAVIGEFQRKELSGTRVGEGVVFYPFSGPDIVYPRTFFPRASTYIMVGLEPPGTLPDLDRLMREDATGYLDRVRQTVYSVLHRSFFITREMDREFRGQVSDGLLPTMLHLLVRTGHTVTGYRFVVLDAAGRITPRPAGELPPSRTGGNSGVEVEFRAGADQSTHKLVYLSTNLSDARLRENQAFQQLVSEMSGMTTYLKATSYMTHRDNYSIIRQLVLGESAAVLQDDSGIPYRFFDAAVWRAQLYGAYTRPYGGFRRYEQPDLRSAYESQSAKPLGFRIGYGFARIPSNLQLALRVGAVTD